VNAPTHNQLLRHAKLYGCDQVYETAVEAGAKEVAVVDTLGIASPEAVTDLVGATLQYVDGLPVHFHGHNDFGVATASAVAAVRAGATWIHGTINGMGERRGNARPRRDCARAPRALRGGHRPTFRPYPRGRRAHPGGIGLRPRAVEAAHRRDALPARIGAVASQFHDPPSIEPYSSELVGAERDIVLGKKSGLDSIRIKVEELGLDVPESGGRTSSRASRSSGRASAASSPTRSSGSCTTHRSRPARSGTRSACQGRVCGTR